MNRKAKILFLIVILVFFVGFIFSSWTLAFVNLPAEYHYSIIYYEGDMPKNLTLIVPIPYIEGRQIVKAKSLQRANVSIIETQYGRMLKVEAGKC